MLGLAVLGLPACSSPEEIDTTVSVTSVSLHPATLTLTVGDTGNLTPTLLPENATNRNVTWSSSNAAIANVTAQGVVNAVSPGTATITVRTVDGGREATATVIVSPVLVTGVTLNKSTLELAVRETETLIATVAPVNATNQNVTWKSRNTEFATVDANGVVTAVAAGTATITVTTKDGAHTADAIVTVITVPVTDIRLSKEEFSFFRGQTETLTATIIPANATNQAVMWQSGNPSVATVDDNGVVTGISVGEADIIVFIDGIFTSSTVTVLADGVLINGITWAARNVDAPNTFAQNPEDFGKFYQWNRNRIDWTLGWNGNDAATWEAANDPCPYGWRVPTNAELISLKNAGSTWGTRNGVNGRFFGTAPNQIFLPAAGHLTWQSGTLSGVAITGNYWSSSLSSVMVLGMSFRQEFVSQLYTNRAAGMSVRCVAK